MNGQQTHTTMVTAFGQLCLSGSRQDPEPPQILQMNTLDQRDCPGCRPRSGQQGGVLRAPVTGSWPIQDRRSTGLLGHRWVQRSSAPWRVTVWMSLVTVREAAPQRRSEQGTSNSAPALPGLGCLSPAGQPSPGPGLF